MMRRRLYLAFVALVGSMQIAHGADRVSFVRDIAPLLKNRCATCHLTGQEPGNLALHPAGAHASLVKVPSVESPLLRVQPGAPEQSYLMRKLDGTHLDAEGSGQRMPFGLAPLEKAELQLVRDWITQGAMPQ